MTDQSYQQQSFNNTDYSLKKADATYHICGKDVAQDKLKEIVQSEGFHAGHEKDIPESKDMMNPEKFKQTAQLVEQHLYEHPDKLQPIEHHEGILEKAKELLIDAKDAIVGGAQNLVSGAKHLFSSDKQENINDIKVEKK
jgi:hypothetical protein